MSLRVVHIVSSLKVGGMEHFVVRLASRQQAAGLCASVLALQGGPLGEEAASLGIETVILGGRSRVLRVFKAISALRRLNPDIVHGHNATSLQYALLAKRFTRAKVVITCHGRGKADHREPAPDLWARVDRVVCVSEAVAREAPSAVPKERLCVIRNGVDTAAPTQGPEAVRRALGLGTEFIAVIVARIDALKGHETLLRAWADILRAHPSAVLLVVGDGHERQAMEKLAADLGIAPAGEGTGGVRFLGFRSDVADLLAAVDLFVLPSLSEGLPLSILEAMTHGLPIVATDVGGIPELITDGVEGLLVTPKDAPGLARAIGRMAASGELRSMLGNKGRQRAKSDFSFEEMLRRYDAVYRAL